MPPFATVQCTKFHAENWYLLVIGVGESICSQKLILIVVKCKELILFLSEPPIPQRHEKSQEKTDKRNNLYLPCHAICK